MVSPPAADRSQSAVRMEKTAGISPAFSMSTISRRTSPDLPCNSKRGGDTMAEKLAPQAELIRQLLNNKNRQGNFLGILKRFYIKDGLESQVVVNLTGIDVKGDVKHVIHDRLGNLSFKQLGAVTGSDGAT